MASLALACLGFASSKLRGGSPGAPPLPSPSPSSPPPQSPFIVEPVPHDCHRDENLTDEQYKAAQSYPYPGFPGEEAACVPVKREVQETTPAFVVYSYPLAQPAGAKITVDKEAGTVTFPVIEQLNAGWAKSLAGVGMYHTGVSNTVMGWNALSVVTNRPFAGIAEKAHTLTHQGPWDDMAARAGAALKEKQSEALAAEARTVLAHRNRATAKAYVASMSAGLLGSLLDYPAFAGIRDFTLEEGTMPAVSSSPELARLKADANAAMGMWGKRKSLGSEDVCVHMEHGPGGLAPGNTGAAYDFSAPSSDLPPGTVLNMTHFTVPLGAKWTTVSGRQYFGPARHLDFLSGTSYWEFDEDTQSVYLIMSIPYLYMVGSAVGNEQPAPYVPSMPSSFAKLMLANQDGLPDSDTSFPVAEEDGRDFANATTHSASVGSFFEAVRVFPADWTIMQADPDELCPPEQRAAVHEAYKEGLADLPALIQSVLDCDGPAVKCQAKRAAAALTALGYAKDIYLALTAVDSIQCVSVYLRNSDGSPQAYDSWEMGIFLHFITETGLNSATVLERYWDDGVIPHNM